MKAIAVNGSPRKNWNTATLLEHALKGAAKAGAETRTVHLYDLNYSGCTSCFACKKRGGRSYGECAVQDDITPLLRDIAEADVLILGTPVYFHCESGMTRSFLERLMFPYLTYTPERTSIFPGHIQTAFIYTMNLPETDILPTIRMVMDSTQKFVSHVLGNCETFLCADTLQFSDYSKYLATRFDGEAKARRHKEVFPEECAQARELGKKLAERSAEHS